MHPRRYISVLIGLFFLAILSPYQTAAAEKVCKVLADKRTEEPLRNIAAEYTRRTQVAVDLQFLPAAEVEAIVAKGAAGYDVVFVMPTTPDGQTKAADLAGARKIVWEYSSGQPVWATALTKQPAAAEFNQFAVGPKAHRLWSGEAGTKACFVCIDHHDKTKSYAELYGWVVGHRTWHTYRMTAMRMLREIGGIRDGIMIDIGCGPGDLDVELAKRSNFKIIGLDIEPSHKAFFEKKMREAGLQDRVSFVQGDAQKLPFPDHHADVIVSRGTLIFIPDIGKCLREVHRVLKPTGVAFLGGRYLYAPGADKITNARLTEIVRDSNVPNAEVIDDLGQWVKIVGPDAPKEARQFQGGPYMLAGRITVDHSLFAGKALLLHVGDGGLEQDLQKGFVELTDCEITALYSSDKVLAAAEPRIRATSHASRIRCQQGTVHALPFEDASFDVVAGVGPILLWGDREKGMREIYRVLRPGGAAVVGGRFLHMPEPKKVPSDTLRQSAARTGIPSVRVYDDMGQWIEIVKGTDREVPVKKKGAN
jgi:ubiquinone/menaquinone biosynthesis C-methylase UbiE